MSCSEKNPKKTESSFGLGDRKRRRSFNFRKKAPLAKDSPSNVEKKHSSLGKGGFELVLTKSSKSSHKKRKAASTKGGSFSSKQAVQHTRSSKTSHQRTSKVRIAPFIRKDFNLHLECVACGEKIQDVLSAIISSQDAQQVYHFDCALKHLKKFHHLKDGEDLLYVGGGDFAVVRYKRKAKGKLCFEICEKIEFEPKKDGQAPVDWRRALRQC